jgi:hypothetical protein
MINVFRYHRSHEFKVGLVSKYNDIQTTMIYTHVLNRDGHSMCSPIDSL